MAKTLPLLFGLFGQHVVLQCLQAGHVVRSHVHSEHRRRLQDRWIIQPSDSAEMEPHLRPAQHPQAPDVIKPVIHEILDGVRAVIRQFTFAARHAIDFKARLPRLGSRLRLGCPAAER